MRPYLKEMAEPRSSEPVVLLNEVFPGDTNALDTVSYTHLTLPTTPYV